MSEIQLASKDTQKHAWTAFINNGRLNNPRIKSEIAASWQRCQHLDPFDRSKPMLSEDMISKKLIQCSEIIALARPFLEELSYTVDNSIVCLADREGVVLDVVGNNELFPVGICCQESLNGTNTIGTTLIEKSPIAIDGYEHYRHCLHSCFSIGTPIWYESDIIGVISVTRLFHELPKETPQILHYIALAISFYIKRRATELNSLIDCVLYGVIIVDKNGNIQHVNKHVVEAMGCESRKELTLQHLSKYVVDANGLLCEIKDETKREYKFKLKASHGLLKCSIRTKERLPALNGSQDNLYLFSFAHYGKENNNEIDPGKLSSFNRLVGSSTALTSCKELALKASKVSSNVLISGESGTGKEMLTYAIHKASGRKGPFVPINCGAIPKELLQSELFGYEEGAFTGGKKGGAIGKFEMADSGTVFLDEIGEMPLEMQVTLLRFLQDKTIFKVGGTKSKTVDVRVIAATNRDLEKAITEGKFREDLYYRLNVININLPPLRQRKEDIPELVKSMVNDLYAGLHWERPQITDETYQILLNYYWPGNVRELRNVIEHAVVFADGAPFITPDCLPPRLFQGKELEQASDLKSRELIIISKALVDHNGNISKTAKALGITRSTLYRKIKEIQMMSGNVSKYIL